MTYSGEAMETGKTAMATKRPAPAIKWLVKEGHIKRGMKVLDYGAGNGRNAEYLRSLGCKVYAYDPFNGSKVSGYEGVTTRKPRGRFDVVFTSFVLNVVPRKVELQIIRATRDFAKRTGERNVFHIVRSEQDLMEVVSNAWPNPCSGKKGNTTIRDWFFKQICLGKFRHGWIHGPRKPTTHDEFMLLCHFGFPTGPGKFQRLVNRDRLRGAGLYRIRNIKGYAIYG